MDNLSSYEPAAYSILGDAKRASKNSFSFSTEKDTKGVIDSLCLLKLPKKLQ